MGTECLVVETLPWKNSTPTKAGPHDITPFVTCSCLHAYVTAYHELSSTGKERVMEITPEYVHQRIPVVMGSKNAVQEVLDAYAAEE